MKIRRTRILNEDRYLGELLNGQHFRLITEVTEARLKRAGFEESPATGSTLLPAIVGRATKINADGRWITRRDLPKEKRYLGSRLLPRKEWHGREQVDTESVVDIYRECYPRDFVPPPAIEITIVELDAKRYFCTPAIQKGGVDTPKQALNMMLELFGETEIVRENLDRLDPIRAQSANWTFLPPGEHPFDRVAEHIDRILARRPLIARFARERQKFIVGLEPDRIVKGEGGFGDYFAYVFESRGLTVLESISVGNAAYVLKQDWETISKLTKADIIRDELHEARVIHTKDWESRLVAALDRRRV